MALTPYVCTNCGFWQRHFAAPPACPVCADHRHVLPDDGYTFLTPDDLAAATTLWDEPEEGVWRFRLETPIGIGPMGYVVCGEGGNVAFEGCGWYSPAALDHIAALGGLAWASASHPHAYGALWQLQERFQPRVALAAADLAWATAFTVTRPYDDALDLGSGLTLHRTGAHFDGHAVLHDASRRILFSGDALKLELDPQDERRAVGISCHKAFVRGVPLTEAELRAYRAVFAPLAFDQVWTPFEQGANAGRAAALALLDELLASGAPHAGFLPVAEEARA
jgi:hypothetical protein